MSKETEMRGRKPPPLSPKKTTGQMAAFNEKPAFPGMGAPGKKGPERSGGVKRAQVYPKSDGV